MAAVKGKRARIHPWEQRQRKVLRALGVAFLFIILASLFPKLYVHWVMWRDNVFIHTMGVPGARAEMTGDVFRSPVNREDAAPYLEAFALFQAKQVVPFYSSIRVDAMEQAVEKPFSAKLLADMRKHLSQYTLALEKLDEAVLHPLRRYPAELPANAEPEQTHVQGAQHAGHALYMRAIVAAEQGVPAEACDILLDLMAVIDSLREEYVYSAQFCRISLLELAQNALKHILALACLSEQELAALQAAWIAAEEPQAALRMLAAERLDQLQSYKYPGMVMPRFEDRWGYFDQYVPKATHRVLIAMEYLGWNAGDKKAFLRGMRRLMDIARNPWPTALPQLDRMTLDYPVPYYRQPDFMPRLSRRIVPQQISHMSFFFESAVELRLTSTALAVERFRRRHGRYPDVLDAVVPEFLPAVPRDLADDAPLRYCFTETGVRVCSISMNRVDDGGRPPLPFQHRSMHGDQVFVLSPPISEQPGKE